MIDQDANDLYPQNESDFQDEPTNPEVQLRRCDRKTILKAKKKTCGIVSASACGRCLNHCSGSAVVEGRRVTCPSHM